MVKRFLALLAMVMMVCSSAFAKHNVNAFVSITDEVGTLVVAYQPVAVADVDGDGIISLGDALAAAHEQYHENGADAFGLAATEFGLSMTKLWNAENGGAYGYSLNDASAWSLLDPLSEGDHVKAFVYTDLAAWSDTYSFFQAPTAQVKAEETLELVLKANGYDENFAPITFVVENAQLAIDGAGVDVWTDAEGKAALSFEKPGTYVVSAFSGTMTLVAPVCIVTVTE